MTRAELHPQHTRDRCAADDERRHAEGGLSHRENERRQCIGAGVRGWVRWLVRACAWMLIALSGGTLAAPAAAALARVARSAPSWSPTEVITGYGLGSGSPAPIGFDQAGDAFVVFNEPVLEGKGLNSLSYLVRVAVRPARGHWQTPETLSRRLGISPAIAVGAQGEAIVAWQALSSVEETERPDGGSWLLPKAVLTPGGEEPQVATDAKGDVLIASTRQAPNHSEGIEVTQRSAGGAFSAAKIISGNENAFTPRVAMNAKGDALVAWRVEPGQGCSVRAAFHVAGGGWSSPRTISGATAYCEGNTPRVAIDEAGDAVVVWTMQRGRSQDLEEATRNTDGRWRSQKLQTNVRDLSSSEVGMDARGDTIVSWSRNGQEEWVRVRPEGHRWLPARMLASSWVLSASLAVDARGDALIAWKHLGRMVAATKSSTDDKWRISTVAALGGDPTAEIDPNGYGVVTWLNHEDLNTAWSISPIG
jgi:hypothetical protein